MGITPDNYYKASDPELRVIAAEQTLAAWRHFGKGPAYIKIGSNVKYSGADLLSWLNANKVTPKAA